jgi:putative membrane protein insertion efficiency factor
MMSFRRLLWSVGAPARLALTGAIAVYRLVLSGWLGGQCRFSPTCSRYAEEAIRSHGAIRGSLLALGRVLRCNPFGRGGLDPVPAARPLDGSQPNHAYDGAIRRAPSHSSERRHAG